MSLPPPAIKLLTKLIDAIHDNCIEEKEINQIRRIINKCKRAKNPPKSRPSSPYILFYKEQFPKLRQNNEKISEVAKQIGKLWRELTPAEKAKYTKK